ncbi:MAG: hypothetical protein ACJ78Q_03420 [Chloroflexia bacterium]
MRTQSRDTHPDAERVQIELLRRMTVAQRAELMRSLTRTTIQLARRAIRQAHPEASEEEVDLIFIEVHYGRDLADRVRAYLSRRAE